MLVIQPRQEDKEFSVCVHVCLCLKLPTTEESLTNVTLERWGRWLCREGQVQAWRAMRQPLQWLMGLTQLGVGGSLVERRSWIGEQAGNHLSRQGGFQEEGASGQGEKNDYARRRLGLGAGYSAHINALPQENLSLGP